MLTMAPCRLIVKLFVRHHTSYSCGTSVPEERCDGRHRQCGTAVDDERCLGFPPPVGDDCDKIAGWDERCDGEKDAERPVPSKHQ